MTDYKMTLIETSQDVEKFLTWLSNDREWLGCDTETDGLVFGRDRVRMVQFGDNTEGFSIPFERGGWGGLVQEVFDKYEGRYVFHNAKFDCRMMTNEGLKLPSWSQIHDTYVMSFLHDNEEPSRKLKVLSRKYLGIDADRGEQELRRYMRQTGHTWSTIPRDNPIYWQYAALDASITAMLADKLWNDVRTYPQAYDTEMAAIKVLMHMEMNGVKVDLDYTQKTLDEMRQEIEDSIDIIVDGTGQPQWYLKEEQIRPNFQQDILQYFAERGIKIPAKTNRKTGRLQLDDEVLEKMDHPVAKKIQRARHLRSWTTNYLEKILAYEWNGRVHPHINPLGSDDKGRTGRMSITDPALSVLEKSALIRDCIVADEDNYLYEIDYKNQELRVIASICNCQSMIESFAKGTDMHKELASAIFGIPIEEVTPDQKTAAKRASFTAAYGGQAKTFSNYMDMPLEEGLRYFEGMKRMRPEMFQYIETQKQIIKQNKVDGYGHIFLSDGRRLNIPAEQSFRAVSYSSQGEAAIVLKRKLVELDAAGFTEYLRIPIHDCIIFEFPRDNGGDMVREAADIMYCTDYTVDLDVDISGPWTKWGDGYRYGE